MFLSSLIININPLALQLMNPTSVLLAARGMSPLLYYLFSALLIVMVLVGISRMSKVEKAVSGNQIGAVSMALAILLTLVYYQIFTVWELWLAMLIGAGLGLWLSINVKMIEMPETVGILNGFGGLASMIAGILTLLEPAPEQYQIFTRVSAGLAIVVGGITWMGSAIAAAKLHKLIGQKPVVYKNHPMMTGVSLGLSLLPVLLFAFPSFAEGSRRNIAIILAVIASHVFGYLFSIRVGGADMPITISLLNSLSGVAGSIAGLAIQDLLLVAVGGIVGASGLLLTEIMCKAMNRQLFDILLGRTSVSQTKGQHQKGHPIVYTPPQKAQTAKKEEKEAVAHDVERQVKEAENASKAQEALYVKEESEVERAARHLDAAESVIIVPGYGMALSQAQSLVKNFADSAESEGKKLRFAIHPVAGRMPGHMNVLLAEVDVPYEQLNEMEAINDDFAETDLVLVIGANDVVNPAANTAEGTPIYGMPVLKVEAARHIVICNFDDKAGYAGVDNPLYKEAEEAPEHVTLILGDAKDSLNALMKAWKEVKNAGAKSDENTAQAAESNKAATEAAATLSVPESIAKRLNEAKRVIIVPGYGMALSQAQPLVKRLMDELENKGSQVDFAIHPVAGRMPGHMNVLLAEVDVPYEKLQEMDAINPEFANTDLALIIGANDVINPAANTAEGTPIYGMPVLDVEAAKHIVICNFDDKAGYAGVDNPLYEEAKHSPEHVTLLLGDAKDSLNSILSAL